MFCPLIHCFVSCFNRLTLPYFQLDTLEADCTAMGVLWPTIFPGSSIKPKLDLLVFVVPTFARKWQTVGGVGEERLEAAHQVYNTHSRILAPMRNKGEMLVVALKREATLKAVGNCSIPTPRKFLKRDPKFVKKKKLDP